MSRLFGGVADVIIVPNYAAINSLDALTISAWVYEFTSGGGGKGRIFDKDPNDFLLFDAGDAANISFAAERWGTDGQFTFARTLNKWTHYLLTYNYSATTNVPVAYVNGASVSVTTAITPVGSLSSPATDLKIGNDITNTRNWSGMIADQAMWNRELSSGEAAAVYAGNPPAVPSGLVLDMPHCGLVNPEPNYANPLAGGVVTLATWGSPSPATPNRCRTPSRLALQQRMR